MFIRHTISLLEKAGRLNEVMYLPQEVDEEKRMAILNEFHSLDQDEKGDVLSTMFRLGSEPERITELRSTSEKNGNDSDQNLLSPGELRKLMISLAVQKPLSLLILDEPTNHMDITSVLALEEALSSLNCAMIVVSHDKAFLSKITNTSLNAIRHGDHGEIVEGSM
jgi:ATPase subunit of ABC transporter with duplicated ATPase domains